jgi:hypothetical protein
LPRVSPRPPRRPGHSKPVGHPVACILALALAGVRSRSVGLGLFGVLFGAAHFFCVVARWLTCDGPLLLAPSPLRGEGWDEGRVLQRPSSCWLVARLLTCGGLSLACRPASSFSLLAHATAGSGGERRSRPEGRRAGCPESREGTKRNGLWSPPTLQALSVEAFWNRRDTSC